MASPWALVKTLGVGEDAGDTLALRIYGQDADIGDAFTGSGLPVIVGVVVNQLVK